MKYIIIFFIMTFFSFSQSQKKVCYTTIPHLDTAIYYYNIPVIEKTEKNDGTYVELIIKKGGGNAKSKDPWCSYFVSACSQVAYGIKTKFKTGLARNISKNKTSIPVKDVIYSKVIIRPGWTINFRNGSTMFGHVGFTYKQMKTNIWQTIEGNIGNRVNITERTYNPRSYQRIHDFTPIYYIKKNVNDYIDTVKLKTLKIKGSTSSNTR